MIISQLRDQRVVLVNQVSFFGFLLIYYIRFLLIVFRYVINESGMGVSNDVLCL